MSSSSTASGGCSLKTEAMSASTLATVAGSIPTFPGAVEITLFVTE
jgi:hypothetical protein